MVALQIKAVTSQISFCIVDNGIWRGRSDRFNIGLICNVFILDEGYVLTEYGIFAKLRTKLRHTVMHCLLAYYPGWVPVLKGAGG